MHKTSARGIDSYIGEFESRDVILNFDYGAYSHLGSLDDFRHYPEFRYRRERIDGEDAKVISFRANPKKGYKFDYVIILVLESHGLTMTVNCKTPEYYETAMRIFKTIKFKAE